MIAITISLLALLVFLVVIAKDTSPPLSGPARLLDLPRRLYEPPTIGPVDDATKAELREAFFRREMD